MLKQFIPIKIDYDLGITNNFDIKHKVINDSIQKFRIKQKIYYNTVRPVLPLHARQLVQRIYNKELKYNKDFIDDSLVNKLRQYGNIPSEYFQDQKSTAIVLTHDIETEQGFKNVPFIFKLTRKYGFKSSWNIVPYKYKIDIGIIKMLQDAGEEIGIHGDNHDGKLFISKHTFEQRAEAINAALKYYGAKGFRAPMVHRNLVWLQQLDIEYDCSCFDYDPFQPFPGGTGFIWPFKAGKFVELPYTIPQDHTMFYELGQTSIDIWINKINWLVQNNGMILSVTHPDYLTTHTHLRMYTELLEYLEGIGNAWRCLPSEISRWWLTKNGKKEAASAEQKNGRILQLDQNP